MLSSSRLPLAVLLLAAPACSKKKEEAPANKAAEPTGAAATTTAAADTPAEAASPCNAAPAALVSQVLGLPGFESSRAETQGPVTICQYKRREAPRSLTLRIESGSQAASAYDHSKEQVKEHEVEDVPGLGDKAYRYTMGSVGKDVGNNVVVLEGEHLLQLSMVGGDPARLAELSRRIAAAL
jgi:hypothetical protein